MTMGRFPEQGPWQGDVADGDAVSTGRESEGTR